MTAPENLTAAHLRDLFHTPIVEMRQAQSELVTAQLHMHTDSMTIQTQLLVGWPRHIKRTICES